MIIIPWYSVLTITSDDEPEWSDNIIMLIGLVLGVYFSDVLLTFFNTGEINFLDFDWGWAILSFLIALMIFANAFDTIMQKPYNKLVILSLSLQNGIFWNFLITGIASGFAAS